MRQVLKSISKNELMGDEHDGCLSSAYSLGSKQTLAAGRVHGEFKSLEENIKPSLMIWDEKIAERVAVSVVQTVPLQGRDYIQVGFASSNLLVLCYPISSTRAKTSPCLVFFDSCKIKYLRLVLVRSSCFSTSLVVDWWAEITWDRDNGQGESWERHVCLTSFSSFLVWLTTDSFDIYKTIITCFFLHWLVGILYPLTLFAPWKS